MRGCAGYAHEPWLILVSVTSSVGNSAFIFSLISSMYLYKVFQLCINICGSHINSDFSL